MTTLKAFVATLVFATAAVCDSTAFAHGPHKKHSNPGYIMWKGKKLPVVQNPAHRATINKSEADDCRSSGGNPLFKTVGPPQERVVLFRCDRSGRPSSVKDGDDAPTG